MHACGGAGARARKRLDSSRAGDCMGGDEGGEDGARELPHRTAGPTAARGSCRICFSQQSSVILSTDCKNF